MGQAYPKQPGQGLPDHGTVIQPKLGHRQAQCTMAGMVKIIFKFTSKFVHIDDDGICGNLTYQVSLVRVDTDSCVKMA